MTESKPVRTAAVLGAGLIGGSVSAALVATGCEVRGWDRDPLRPARAVDLGIMSKACATIAEAVDGCEVAIVAVPVGAAAGIICAVLGADPNVIVTDVGSVKGSVLAEVEAAVGSAASRFVGGHPMAGSELDGLDGANPNLFQGATWVLTPTDLTDAGAFATIRSLVADMGAEAIAVTPHDHDLYVATVSHVPQLAASTLMDTALGVGAQHSTLLRLAAGGFRDMTRIAAGNPAIWPDIFSNNKQAVLTALDRYMAALTDVRRHLESGDRAALLTMLQRARQGRRSLPLGATAVGELAEIHVLVPDRPGVIAEITTLAGRLGVNVFDLEIAHSIEGDRGVMVLVVAAGDNADTFEAGLRELGYSTSRATFE